MSTTVKQNVATTRKTTKTVSKRKEDEKEGKRNSVASRNSVGKATTSTVSASSVSIVSTGSKPIGTSKKRISISPTSTRVSKSQYYPDKTLYSNALSTAPQQIKPPLTKPSIVTKPPTKNARIVRESSSDRSSKLSERLSKPVPERKSKTLAEVKKEMRNKIKKSIESPSSKKSVKSPISSSSSSSSQFERPRTATLMKPSIVSTNIAGPDAKKLKKDIKNTRTESINAVNIINTISIQSDMDSNTELRTELGDDAESIITKEETDDGDNYEDDFDSYASDFEEYNSSQVDSESSSESLEVSTNSASSSSSSAVSLEDDKPPTGPPSISRPINSAEEERKLDSGNFDMSQDSQEPKKLKILDQIKEHEPVLSSLSDEGFEEQKSSLQFVNFVEAKKLRQRHKSQRKASKRGEDLMGMIRLDQQNFTLFDLPAQSYDVFIKSFGNRNSTQVASQTGDDFVDEEVQTEVIETVNKWTQFPIDKITKSKNPVQFRAELLGVGSDTIEGNLLNDHLVVDYNEYKLKKFLLLQEKLISELLKENHYGNQAEMSSGKFPFTQGYLMLNTETIGPITLITFSNSNKNPKIITVHNENNMKSNAFVWSLQKPQGPEDNFTAFGEISDVTFGLDNDKLIFGGFKDGSIAVWDLLEDSSLSRPPSFLTDVDFGSTEVVVKVLCFKPLKSNDFQVITLNEIGKIVIWGLVISPTQSLGLNRISLIRNHTIFLGVQHQTGPHLQCTDLCLSQSDPNHFYVSTNFGLILHSLISGTRTNPRQYNTGLSTSVNTIEGCPHNPNYFLAGCATGEVILHSKKLEKPLMTISNQVSDAAVNTIQWSKNRPCIFYTLDADDNINIWDLSVSELYPQVTVHLKEKVKVFKVSPIKAEKSYMAVVTGDGKLHLHLLNQEHGMQEIEVYDGDLRKLIGYVKKL